MESWRILGGVWRQRTSCRVLMLLGALVLVLCYTTHAAVVLTRPERLPPFLHAFRQSSDLIFRALFAFHVTALATLMHWFSRKLFKHNSA
ncbi:hypothetical protein CHLRE_11g467667v5 [Chlamydomonas reinhardtii]|uniref:Uncharacterized protein n=1 Tax=Chlamydomonas reinhardtii TaxID=3055 RepID=A0A2K3D7M2_CHLRE|nr:uncharacterized protein CHLRE_11g467667v5 [Chlamydomonas reinhardtii]PNW76527.1 hypothetical protein CHLRE_11g467667v5 [Chlamydomonas reinhardtii]